MLGLNQPMSSPMMTRMFGFFAAPRAAASDVLASTRSTATDPRRAARIRKSSCQSFEGEDLLPVRLHVDDDPLLRGRLVECLVELPHVRRPVVRPLALGVG